MFPVLVTRVLPGQIVAASVQIHGWEATLAVLTILTWHLYEVVLRPDIFPADTTIFTGRISKDRMIEEHSLEYQEIKRKEARQANAQRQGLAQSRSAAPRSPEAPPAT
jgi:formate dehydrogenase subunit gamma